MGADAQVVNRMALHLLLLLLSVSIYRAPRGVSNIFKQKWDGGICGLEEVIPWETPWGLEEVLAPPWGENSNGTGGI